MFSRYAFVTGLFFSLSLNSFAADPKVRPFELPWLEVTVPAEVIQHWADFATVEDLIRAVRKETKIPVIVTRGWPGEPVNLSFVPKDFDEDPIATEDFLSSVAEAAKNRSRHTGEFIPPYAHDGFAKPLLSPKNQATGVFIFSRSADRLTVLNSVLAAESFNRRKIQVDPQWKTVAATSTAIIRARLTMATLTRLGKQSGFAEAVTDPRDFWYTDSELFRAREEMWDVFVSYYEHWVKSILEPSRYRFAAINYLFDNREALRLTPMEAETIPLAWGSTYLQLARKRQLFDGKHPEALQIFHDNLSVFTQVLSRSPKVAATYARMRRMVCELEDLVSAQLNRSWREKLRPWAINHDVLLPEALVSVGQISFDQALMLR